AVLFQELIKQHRVHRLVAHGVGFALIIASYQSRVYLFHVLSHQPELLDAIGVKLVLVAEGHRFKREDGFARLVHWLDRFPEARRGVGRAEMTVGVYDNCYTSWTGCPTNPSDKCRRVISCPANTNGVRLASQTSIADVDVFIAGG